MHLSKFLALTVGLRGVSAVVSDNIDGQAQDPLGGQAHASENKSRDRPLTHSLADIDHVILLMQGMVISFDESFGLRASKLTAH